MVAAACPNPSDPRWKALIKDTDNDPIQAYEVWYKNGRRFPDKIESEYDDSDGKVPPTIDLEREFSDANKIIKAAVDVLNAQIKELTPIAMNSEAAAFLKDKYSTLIDSFQKEESAVSILLFIKAADEMTNSYLKWMTQSESKPERTIHKLSSVINGVDALNVINSIRPQDFEEYFNSKAHSKLKFSDMEDVEAALARTKDKMSNIKREAIRQFKEILKGEMAPYVTTVQDYFARQAEIEFYNTVDTDKYKSRKEVVAAKEEFIRDYMIQMQPFIKDASNKHLDKVLNNFEDVVGWDMWATNPKDMSNELVAFITEMADRSDFEISNEMNDANATMNKLHKEYIKFYKPVGSSFKDLYAPFLYTHKDPDTDEEETRFMHEKAEGYDEFKSKYENTPVWDLFEFFTSLQKDSNQGMPKFFRLLEGKLPQIDASDTEMLYNKGIVKGLGDTIKHNFLDRFRVTSKDTDIVDETVAVNVSEKGEKIIPLRYRKKVKSEQSFDLPTIFLLDYANTLNYKSKVQMSSTLNLLKTTIGAGNVIVRDHNKGLMTLTRSYDAKKTGAGNLKTKSGLESNLYRLVDSIIEHRVYGINMKGSSTANKMTQNVKRIVSMTNMAMNPFAGVSNYAQGHLMLLFDAIGEQTGLFSMKNRVNAELKWKRDHIEVLKDLMNNSHQSKTNLLLDALNIKESLIPSTYANDNVFTKLLEKSPLMWMNKYPEFATKVLSMYSFLDNVKVLDEDGNFIAKDGSVTTNRDEALSIDEAYDVVDGKLVLKYANTFRTEKTTSMDLFPLSRMTKRLLRRQYGNMFDEKNKSMAEREWWGALASHMRGWLLTGIHKHWGGITSARVRKEHLTQDQLHHNKETGLFEEGVYTTAVRFLYTVISDWKDLKFKAMTQTLSRLTDQERQNLYIFVAQSAATVVALVMFSMFYYDDDDEPTDDPTELWLAFISIRLYSELFSFANPKETFRSFTTPAVSTGYVTKFLDAGSQLLSDMYHVTTGQGLETYETGPRKDEYKIVHRLAKLTPVWNQYDRDVKETLQFYLK